MMTVEETGLEVLDLRNDQAFAARSLHVRDIGTQMEGLQRLSRALLEKPDTILQELVSAAVALCGADSAGISIEKEDGTDQEFYHWVATAGDYSVSKRDPPPQPQRLRSLSRAGTPSALHRL